MAATPLQQETAIWQAFKDKNVQAFGSMFAPDYVGFDSDGPTTRAKQIDAVQASKIESFGMNNFASRMISPDDLLTTDVVEVKGRMGNQDVSGRYQSASLWHRSGSKWLTADHCEMKAG